MPDVCVNLYDLVRAGRHDEARALQRRLTPLAVAVTGTYGVAGLKATMEMAGYVGGAPRMPLRPVTHEARETLKRLYEELVST
jgi:4-hydroxy-2-oxoglutarate aldolase